MTDYIKVVADWLIAGTPVVLYTAAGETLSVIKQLKLRFHCVPTAVCDSSPEKQGKSWKGLPEGMKVISFDDAITRFPNALFYVTSIAHRAQIFGEIVSSGKISSDRILNYEPVVKKTSCRDIERTLTIYSDRLTPCCVAFGLQPFIETTDSADEMLDEYLALRERLINSGALETYCEKCLVLKNDWYPIDNKIQMINYSEGGVCNFNCAYCRYSARGSFSQHGKAMKSTLPNVLTALRAKDMLHPQWNIKLAHGEPALDRNLSVLLDSFIEFGGQSLIVNTNASVFSDALFQLANTCPVYFIVSIDAGTKETFKSLRGVDALKQVTENLKRYASADMSQVALKYIFCPGINDNVKDIDGFASLFAETGATVCQLTYDAHCELPVPHETQNMMARLSARMDQEEILRTSVTNLQIN